MRCIHICIRNSWNINYEPLQFLKPLYKFKWLVFGAKIPPCWDASNETRQCIHFELDWRLWFVFMRSRFQAGGQYADGTCRKQTDRDRRRKRYQHEVEVKVEVEIEVVDLVATLECLLSSVWIIDPITQRAVDFYNLAIKFTIVDRYYRKIVINCWDVGVA